MVIQVPGPLKDAQFVTSSEPGVDRCRLEILRWLSKSGYTPTDPNRVFAIFQHGEIVREWNLMEKQPTSSHS